MRTHTGLICRAAAGGSKAGHDLGCELLDLSARAGKVCDIAVDRLGTITDASDRASGNLGNKLIDGVGSHEGGEDRYDNGVLHLGGLL